MKKLILLLSVAGLMAVHEMIQNYQDPIPKEW